MKVILALSSHNVGADCLSPAFVYSGDISRSKANSF